MTIALVPLCSRVAVQVCALDMPGARKVHPAPVPRCGGAAMALGAIVPIVLWVSLSQSIAAYLCGCAVLIAAGLYDDFKGLGYQAKFMAQVAAAMLLVLYGGVSIRDLGSLLPGGMLLPRWLADMLTVFVVVGVTNAINLADGLDGLAGGISLLIFLFMSYLAYQAGNLPVAVIALALSGTLFGFLRFNTHPAVIFMGDTGSMLLGFSAAALSIMLTQCSTPLSPLLPLILLGFPILDTLAVMALRVSEGRSPFSADKNHFHHRLLKIGMFQTEAVFTIYVIQFALILFAWTFRFHSEWLLLLSYGLFSALVVGFFAVADRTGWTLKRYDLIDRVIKGRLKALKGRRLPIRLSFPVVHLGLPALLLLLACLPASVPAYLSLLAACLAGALALVGALRREWLARVFMPCLYVFVPLLVYAGEVDAAEWLSPRTARLLDVTYGVLAFFSVLTLKFTYRAGGFRISPMDFIVVVLALAVTALPREILPVEAMKSVIPKILALFFGYEVLSGELRGDLRALTAVTVATLVIVAVRGSFREFVGPT
ncbi:MAG: undecaprenyl/decaprenyl-phosphate alpha-N-acetylglucosaminyl 1-phosphate transferase [Syntrophaceae bacterium]|nr:undecaprenyl/decaprenyl-phosphate alpha-N-acetylglucosaminyl 1-phosphate transferase [Syntrophaceae bacterium]